MKTTLAVILAALVLPTSATASSVLTVKEVRHEARTEAEMTLGALVYRSVGSAAVSIGKCRVAGRRGQCRIVVNGLQRCTFVGHVLKEADGFVVWGTGVRCDRPKRHWS